MCMKYLWNPIQVVEHSLQGKNFGGGHKVKAHVGIGGSLETGKASPGG